MQLQYNRHHVTTKRGGLSPLVQQEASRDQNAGYHIQNKTGKGKVVESLKNLILVQRSSFDLLGEEGHF